MTPHRSRVLVAAVAVAALIAGCGSSSQSSSSLTGHPSPAQIHQAQQDAVRFADCMRSHGVSNFPDPTTSPREFKDALETQSPAFHLAETACKHLLPGGGPGQSTAQSAVHTAALVAFARCLRSHGFPNFPDPTSSGELTPEMLAKAGINLHQPAVEPAADACVAVTHGVITRADVARAVNRSNAAGP